MSITKRTVVGMVYAILLMMQAINLQAQVTSKLTSNNLKTNGLTNKELFLKLFVGNFSAIDFQHDDLTNSFIFMSYVNSYSRRCSNYLPPDKIQLTKQVCIRERVTTNGFGQVVDRTCIESETRPTGTYISPKMYQAKSRLEAKAGIDLVSELGEAMKGGMGEGMGYAMKQLDRIKFSSSVQQDMDYLIRAHSCTSPELMHFQENLRLYALAREPVRLKYDKTLFAGPPPPSTSEKQNYDRLVDDLVRTESKTWMMNRYINGSISDVNITSSNQDGYPSRIKAYYRFRSFGNDQHRGYVTVTFVSGIPKCLYFFDFPKRCREPNKQIVSAYSKGNYSRRDPQ